MNGAAKISYVKVLGGEWFSSKFSKSTEIGNSRQLRDGSAHFGGE
jgi:hypothetical protein